MYRAENTLKPLSLVCIMSSTTNVQNLLTNVFRPTFVYTAGTGYQSKLELTNIDTVSANTVTTFAANVGDASSNVYVGVGAGNAHSALAASSNTTDTFLGALAGAATSNVKNSVFLGFYAGYGSSNASNSISIGANTANGGNSNIYIGCGTGITTGSNNIFLGPGVTNGGVATSNTLLIGSGNNPTIIGDLTNRRIAVGTSTMPDPSTYIMLDVNGYTRIGPATSIGGLGINTDPGQGYTLDVNGNSRVSGGFASVTGTIRVLTGTTSNIYTTKVGHLMIAVRDDYDGTNYASRTYFFPTTTNPLAVIIGVTSVGTSIGYSSGNITITNTTGAAVIYKYSITYFPLL